MEYNKSIVNNINTVSNEINSIFNNISKELSMISSTPLLSSLNLVDTNITNKLNELIKEINSSFEFVSDGISLISKSEGDIFDLISVLFAITLIILALLGCIECLNTAFLDKSRKKNKIYFQKLNKFQDDHQM